MRVRPPRRVARSPRVLLVLDLVSEFRFPGWQGILAGAKTIAPHVARLASRARASGVAVIYVNDTAGQWESDQTAFIERCLDGKARGRDMVRQVVPERSDYFMFKPKHSGFYGTPLAQLLEQLAAKELILTGLTSHQCVLFTAMDAYVRDYRLVVPTDCIAARRREETRHALFVLENALMARTPRSSSVRFKGPVR